jgi:hypothetical protein
MLTNTSVPRERLTSVIDSGLGAHLRPIWIAVRDADIACCIVPQGHEPFDPPENKPTVLILGDDMMEALGPPAFHRPSLRRFIKRCHGAVLVACEPLPVAYGAAAATAAGLRVNIAIIETRPNQEAAWKTALDAINPDLAYIHCKVRSEGGVN